jgi:hypothetical protein
VCYTAGNLERLLGYYLDHKDERRTLAECHLQQERWPEFEGALDELQRVPAAQLEI